MHWHPESTTSDGMAVDGFHPNSNGYAQWAEELSRHILEIGSIPHIQPFA
jgi:lysophospholipase L1-like esterase